MKPNVSDIETPDLDELRAFDAIARTLGVTAAAHALEWPKSAVSKRLTALEARLRVRLLERSSRRVRLTREGERLLPRVQSILAEMQQLLADSQAERGQAEGAVRVAAAPEFGQWLSAHFVPPLLAAHPKLQLAMRLDYAFEDLLDPAIDLAFRIGQVNDERLVARPLGELVRVLVASPAFAAAHALRSPQDLEALPALLFSDRDHQASWTLRPAGGGAAVEVSVRSRLSLRSFSALVEAAARGLGVARVPTIAAQAAIERGALVRILPAWASLPSPVLLAHRFGAERIARVGRVIDFARERLPSLLSSAGAV